MSIGHFSGYQWIKASFGGEIAFKGFPSNTETGYTISIAGLALAITATSENKDGAVLKLCSDFKLWWCFI